MTPNSKNFTVATAFMRNEQGTTYIWVLEQIKHLYVSSVMSTGKEAIVNDGEPIVIIIDRESGLIVIPRTPSLGQLWLGKVTSFGIPTRLPCATLAGGPFLTQPARK
ncbi:hypothetical protein M9H77_22402 [Catharanthus roseus]|uniref:Uncharacterized protein n=1 Tax=Catharanthus roseus TaxID=4058 RepID=A0ACC0ARA5_CATRO|nr:hypothetical protein M9H77_22402 [Catharanthus roseus]